METEEGTQGRWIDLGIWRKEDDDLVEFFYPKRVGVHTSKRSCIRVETNAPVESRIWDIPSYNGSRRDGRDLIGSLSLGTEILLLNHQYKGWDIGVWNGYKKSPRRFETRCHNIVTYFHNSCHEHYSDLVSEPSFRFWSETYKKIGINSLKRC